MFHFLKLKPPLIPVSGFCGLFNLWITRSVRNKLSWALRHANVSLRYIDTFIISCLTWEHLRSTIPECQRDAECALCPEHSMLWFWSFQRMTSCLHVDFECLKISTMADPETEFHEFLKLFYSSRSLTWQRDEKLLFDFPNSQGVYQASK